jgi:hypothetical protein
MFGTCWLQLSNERYTSNGIDFLSAAMSKHTKAATDLSTLTNSRTPQRALQAKTAADLDALLPDYTSKGKS